MKLIVFALVGVLACASAMPVEEEGWNVPNDDGTFFWMSRDEYEQASHIGPRALGAVKFYLFTKAAPNTAKLVALNDANALTAAGFNKNYPTRILIHGWKGDLQAGINTNVRAALFATGNFNVICVDWSANAQTINYISARNSVPDVGRVVANFADFLNLKGGMSFSTLHVIGHSLGAHVSGFTGKYVTRGKVNSIYGLDPAFPLFSYKDCATRLCTTDASYVESIQTNGGELGFLEPIGKSAFYPNGGKTQPGCGVDLTGGCAHERSYLYYSEAIRKNDFPTMKCANYKDANDKKCGSTYSSVRMGAASNYGVAGVFYTPVNSASPYGMA